MKTLSIIITSIALTLTSYAGTSGAKWEDFSQKDITAHLAGSLDDATIAVRVKGLVCESCGIGLRKKISKIDAVNTKQEKKGITMDVYKMLLVIKLDKGKAISSAELKKAIEDAGYEGVYLYQSKGGKVVSSTL